MTDFEKILQDVLARDQSQGQSQSEQNQSGGVKIQDFLSDLIFNRMSFKGTASQSFKKYQTASPSPKTEKTKLSFQFTSQSQESPTGQKKQNNQNTKTEDPSSNQSSSKKAWTYDQLKAIRVFANFGETEINEKSTDQQIRKAYKRLAKKFHPDAGARNDDFFKIISEAYQKLIH